MYDNKYALTLDENIFLAKKTLVESIYAQAKMENIAITFPDTQTLINGTSVSGLTTDDVQKVLNLRNAWRFILDDITHPVTLDYITSLQAIVTYGELPQSMQHTLRTGDVNIGGSFYQPVIPNVTEATAKIAALLASPHSITEKALDYFLFACRSQLFGDGNKRTASIIANKLLIASGAGVMIIPEK